MIKRIVGIIGRTCSGKSTVAKSASKEFNIPLVSFGKYLVDYSIQNGLPTDKKSLQHLGNEFIQSDSNLFLRNVISSLGDTPNIIMIEGIRHISIFKAIKLLSESSFFLFLDAPASVRYERFCQRENKNTSEYSLNEFLDMENHVVESEIDSLRIECEETVDTQNLKPDSVLQIIKDRLQVSR